MLSGARRSAYKSYARKRGSVPIRDAGSLHDWREALAQAGLVLDYAPELADSVLRGEIAVDAVGRLDPHVSSRHPRGLDLNHTPGNAEVGERVALGQRLVGGHVDDHAVGEMHAMLDHLARTVVQCGAGVPPDHVPQGREVVSPSFPIV
jgi:hypothetical protein